VFESANEVSQRGESVCIKCIQRTQSSPSFTIAFVARADELEMRVYVSRASNSSTQSPSFTIAFVARALEIEEGSNNTFDVIKCIHSEPIITIIHNRIGGESIGERRDKKRDMREERRGRISLTVI
jgi:hypothetical protein